MKKTHFIIGLIIFSLSIFSCKDNKKNEGDSKVVTAAYVPSGYYLPFLIVEHDQLLEKKGYTFKLKSFNSNSDMINNFVNGNLDVTAQSALTMLPIEGNYPDIFKFIYGQYNYSYSFVVKKDSDIKSIKDLKGKKIGTWTSPTAINCIKICMREEGIVKEEDYTIKTYGATSVSENLLNDNVDAVFLFDVPCAYLVEENGCRYLKKSAMSEMIEIPVDVVGSDEYKNSYEPLFNGGGFLHTRLISENPKKANIIREAFHEAINIINTEPLRVQKILADKIGQSENAANKAVYDKFHIPNKDMMFKLANETEKILFKHKLLKKHIDVENLFWIK